MQPLCSPEPGGSRFLLLGQLQTLPLSLPLPSNCSSLQKVFSQGEAFQGHIPLDHTRWYPLLSGISLLISLFYRWPHPSLQDLPFHSLLLFSLPSAHPKELVLDSTCCILTYFTLLSWSPKQGRLDLLFSWPDPSCKPRLQTTPTKILRLRPRPHLTSSWPLKTSAA